MLDTLFQRISQVENYQQEEFEENFDFGTPNFFYSRQGIRTNVNSKNPYHKEMIRVFVLIIIKLA